MTKLDDLRLRGATRLGPVELLEVLMAGIVASRISIVRLRSSRPACSLQEVREAGAVARCVLREGGSVASQPDELELVA